MKAAIKQTTKAQTLSGTAYSDRQQDFSGDYTPAHKGGMDFSNAENPLGCALGARAAIEDRLSGAGRYPSPYAADLARALCAVHGLRGRKMAALPVAGAGAGILLCVQAFLRQGQNVVMPEASFPVALFGASGRGGFGRMVRMKDDLGIDLAALAGAVDRDTAFVFLCNPNNPTGAVLPPADILAFAKTVPVPVVVSEAGADYAGVSCLDCAGLPDNLIVVRSFSKIHGLAGLRVGAVIAAEGLIRRITAVHCPFTVGVLAEAAAIAALRDPAHVERSRVFMDGQRAFLMRALAGLGLPPLPSGANMMMVPAPARFENAAALCAALKERGCSVIDGACFGAAARGYIRIAPRTEDMNAALIGLLREVGA